ncbi:MAG: DNA polymerase III subunit beta [Acidobacteriota bacterium]|nr:DNA polymerase III subunit beta [Acidobacteriota bacterium]
MEFVIKQSALKDELGFVQGIVEKKSTIPVLSNILIESVGENTIRIVGTDLDVTIRCEAEAEIKKAGSMCVQARKLFDIVRLLPDSDVHFTKDEKEWVKLNCGKSNFRLAGVNREQFPEVPNFKSAPMKLSAEIFNHFIHNTSFAITNEQSRFTLSGAKFMVDGNMARMVTTDGHRLAFIEKQLTGNTGTMDALIPKKALMELTKISRDAKGEVSFGEDENHIYFEVDGRLLITRKLSGSFPNYEMVIPKDNDKVAVFDAEEMKNAIRRVALMADERTRSVRITIKPNEIEIGAQSSEEGEADEKIAADYNGDEINIGFNSQYLQEFLNVVGSGETETSEIKEKETDGETVRVKENTNRLRIAFEFKDGNAQTQLNIAGDKNYDYKYIVMPLRI